MAIEKVIVNVGARSVWHCLSCLLSKLLKACDFFFFVEGNARIVGSGGRGYGQGLNLARRWDKQQDKGQLI